MKEKKIRRVKSRIKKCTRCGKHNPAGSKECEHCGVGFKSINKPSLWLRFKRLMTGNNS